MSFPKSHFGRYVEVVEIARGGMGLVASAVDPELERTVALKFLHDDCPEEHQRKFLIEARITGQLQHPNIVPVHELGHAADGRRFFSMKLVRGKSLREELDRIRHFEGFAGSKAARRRLLSIFLRICDAVAFAHSRGVIHRDLKPANVMLGEFGEVLVMDWGLAKTRNAELGTRNVGAGPESADSTLAGTVLGTPSYMPPEQAMGRVNEIDERSDVYSLGAILYHLLALSPPFLGETKEEVILRVARGTYESPSARAPEAGIPRELDAVVAKAMAYRRMDRYASVKALQDEVSDFLEGRALEAARYNPFQLAAKWVGRHPALSGIVAAVLVVAAALGGAFHWREVRARRSRILEAIEEADRQVSSAGSLETALEAARLAAGSRSAASPRRDRAFEAYLAAQSALDRALSLDPGDVPVIEKRREVGLALGRLAFASGDYTLARQAFADLVRFGAASDEVEGLVAAVDSARSERARREEARLAEILAALAAGLSDPGRGPGAPLVEDYVSEALSFEPSRVARILEEAIEPLAEKARREGESALWDEGEEAVVRFSTTVLGRIGPRAPEAVRALARFLGAVRDPELAATVGEALTTTRSVEANFPLLDARELWGTDSPTWRRIRRSLGRLPDPPPPEGDAAGLLGVAILHEEKEHPHAAIEAYSRALELDPRMAKALSGRALVRMRQLDLAGAIEDFSDALATQPGDTEALVNRGYARHLAGEPDRALEDFSAAIALAPGEVRGWRYRGDVRRERGDFAGAIEDYSRALAIAGSNAEVASDRALARWSLGDRTGARADFDLALAIDPSLANAWSSRAGLRLDEGDLDGAIADASRAIVLAPRHASAYLNRASARRKKREFEGAVADYSKATEIEPTYVEAWWGLGTAHYYREDHTLAEGALSKAIELKSDFSAAWLNRGMARMKLERYEEAMADLDRAIALNSSYALAHLNRGILRLRLGDPPGALVDFDRAIEIDPTSDEAHYHRGGLRESEGNLDDALADFARAKDLDPASWRAWGRYGRILATREIRRDEGLAALARSLELAPAARKAEVEAWIAEARR